MASVRSKFWDELNDDLQDPEYRVAFEDEVARVRAHDRIFNTLNEAIAASGMPTTTETTFATATPPTRPSNGQHPSLSALSTASLEGSDYERRTLDDPSNEPD